MFSAFRNTTLAAIVAGLALSSPARAGIITLDVSGTMSPIAGLGAGACSPTCTLGGDIVINNSPPAPGTILSEHVTATGFSPTVGPFTVNGGISGISGGVDLSIFDAAHDQLSLLFATPTAGSLVGYAGGPLSAATGISPPFFGDAWLLSSGSLTPAPEPPSLVLLLSALASLGALLARKDAQEGCG